MSHIILQLSFFCRCDQNQDHSAIFRLHKFWPAFCSRSEANVVKPVTNRVKARFVWLLHINFG